MSRSSFISTIFTGRLAEGGVGRLLVMTAPRRAILLPLLLAIAWTMPTLHGEPASVNLSRDLVALGIAAQNMVPNNPALDSRPLFQAAVEYVKSHHIPLITADTGAYYFLTPQSIGAYVGMFNLSALTIDLAGSTIYFQEPYRIGLVLGDSQHVTLKNFNTDYVVVPYSHVQVTAVDATARRISYTTLPGWADPTTFNNTNAPPGYGPPEIWVVAFRDGQIVPGTSRMLVSRPLPAGRVDLSPDFRPPWTEGALLATIHPGDTLVITARAGPSPLLMYGDDALTLNHITLYGSAGWAAVLQQLSNSVIDDVRVMPRPGGLIGSNGDGLHLSWSHENNVIRNCYITRTVDDGIAIDSLAVGTILRQDGPRRLHVKRFGNLRFPNGTPLNFVDAASTVEIAGGVVVSQSPPDTPSPENFGEVDLTFDHDLPSVPIGGGLAYASSDWRGSGSIIEDNVLDDILGRGVWVSGIHNVSVRRNRIGATAQAAIAVTQDTLSFPGPPSRDIVIESNILTGALGPLEQITGSQTALGAIEVSTTDNNSFALSRNMSNANMTIRSNYVSDSGRTGIWVGETNGATIQDNVIIRWNRHPELPLWGMNLTDRTLVQADFPQPIAVHFSANVAVTNNTAALVSTLTGPVTISASAAALDGGRATGSVTVQPIVAGFSWRAQSDSSWLTATPSVGTGVALLAFTAAPNNTGAVRVGTVMVAGATVRVTQQPLRQITLDFDGDGRADVGVYRGSIGTWYFLKSGTNYSYGSYASYNWGVSTDIPVPRDYDGDGKTDVAVYRPSTGTWYILLSSTNFTTYNAYQWGISSDIPVPADYDGDGKTDVAIFRPSTGTWYLLLSSTNSTTYASYQWGVSTDIPVPADYDGDGKTDVAVFRPSTGTWYLLRSSTNSTTYSSYQWGGSTDIPVAGDYDGDGSADVAVYRPSTGTWFILRSSTDFTTYGAYQWGISTDVPVPNDYDGDGKTDVAVFRPDTGVWYILSSSSNFSSYVSYQWGVNSDIPLSSRP